MCHFSRWNALLSADSAGPVANEAPLHLQQSDLDGACGLHCALMVLMLFGLVDRRELERPGDARDKALATFWKNSTPHYFHGMKARKLKQLLKPYRRWLKCRLAKKDPARQAGKIIDRHGVAILGIANSRFSHWVLAIGRAGVEGSSTPDKLLILDPGYPPIALLPWNATLSFTPSRRKLHRYESAEQSIKVSLEDALLLNLRMNKEDVELELDIEELLNAL